MGGDNGTPESAATVAAGSKRKTMYALMLSPPAKVAKGGCKSPEDGAGLGRPTANEDEIIKDVNALYRWQWRSKDGTYVAFDTKQCIEIKTRWQQTVWGARVWGKQFPVGQDENLKCQIDFEDMSACIVGSEWVTTVWRWHRDMAMGDSWDHQSDNVRIVNVQRDWRDYAVVLSAFFDR